MCSRGGLALAWLDRRVDFCRHLRRPLHRAASYVGHTVGLNVTRRATSPGIAKDDVVEIALHAVMPSKCYGGLAPQLQVRVEHDILCQCLIAENAHGDCVCIHAPVVVHVLDSPRILGGEARDQLLVGDRA